MVKISEESKLSLQKALVGHYIENIPDKCKKKVSYVLQGDGLWQVRKNEIGTFYIHMYDTIIPGLECNLEAGWELNVPKIPVELWNMAISFFKDVNRVHNSEAYLQFFYDEKDNEYILHCPKQVVSGASVKYENDEMFESDKILVLEVHSHNSMGAFFSGIDDSDEKSDRFFGVIGKVNTCGPEYKLRLMMGGFPVEVDLEDIFEIENAVEYPKDWLSKIEKRKAIKKKGYSDIKRERYSDSFKDEDWLFDKELEDFDSYKREELEIFSDEPIYRGSLNGQFNELEDKYWKDYE